MLLINEAGTFARARFGVPVHSWPVKTCDWIVVSGSECDNSRMSAEYFFNYIADMLDVLPDRDSTRLVFLDDTWFRLTGKVRKRFP